MSKRQRSGSLPPMDGVKKQRAPPPPPQFAIPPTFVPCMLLSIGLESCRSHIHVQRIQMERIQEIPGLNPQQKMVIKEGLEQIKRELEIYGRVVHETMVKLGVDGEDLEEEDEIVVEEASMENPEKNSENE